jgi:multiple sugar transport system ATP-binding protein
MASLSLQAILKSYGEVHVIKDVSLEIADREFIVFVGPSGCGKSTLLRMIAGLESITAGTLLIDDRRMNEVGPADRGLSMVFQSYALYPHMTVRQNMSFALRLAKVSKAERDRKVAEVARILHLDEYLDRKPGQLSGGQRQRVAIGRAIVRNPKIFLFDEPLSNLDASLRGMMRVELARLHETLNATMIYVTHDQVEAMTLADRIVVLQSGRIEQVGTPLDIYHRPNSLFVAQFIGSPPMNLLSGRISSAEGSDLTIELRDGGTMTLPVGAGNCRLGDEVTVGIRAEACRPGPEGALVGTVTVIERLGALSLLYVDLDHGGSVAAQSSGIDGIRPHQTIRLKIDTAQCHVFDQGGRALPRRCAQYASISA